MKILFSKLLSSHIALICIVVSVMLVGCTVVGKNISQEQQIRFTESGSGKGEYKYGQLKVGYQYVVKGSDLHLSGTISYTSSFDSLNVRVILFDAAGVILQQNLVFSSGYKTISNLGGGHPFEEVIPMPVGVEGLSFTSVSKDRLRP